MKMTDEFRPEDHGDEEQRQWTERRGRDRIFDIIYHFATNSGSPARGVLYLGLKYAPVRGGPGVSVEKILADLPDDLPLPLRDFCRLTLEAKEYSKKLPGRGDDPLERGRKAFDPTVEPIDLCGFKLNPYATGTPEHVWWECAYESAVARWQAAGGNVNFTFTDDGKHIHVADLRILRLADDGLSRTDGAVRLSDWEQAEHPGKWSAVFKWNPPEVSPVIVTVWWYTSVDDKTGGEARIKIANMETGEDIQRFVMIDNDTELG